MRLGSVDRFESGETNLDTLVAGMAGDGERRLIALESFVIEDGAMVFHDRSIEPERTWRASRIDVRLQNLDAEDPARGTNSATLALAGAPTRVAWPWRSS